MSEQKMKPIWYFVGMILFVMGLLVVCSGIYQMINPPEVKTILAETQPSLWWGGIMMVFGGLMFFSTRKQTR